MSKIDDVRKEMVAAMKAGDQGKKRNSVFSSCRSEK